MYGVSSSLVDGGKPKFYPGPLLSWSWLETFNLFIFIYFILIHLCIYLFIYFWRCTELILFPSHDTSPFHYRKMKVLVSILCIISNSRVKIICTMTASILALRHAMKWPLKNSHKAQITFLLNRPQSNQSTQRLPQVHQFYLYSAYADVWHQLCNARVCVNCIKILSLIFLLYGNNGGTVSAMNAFCVAPPPSLPPPPFFSPHILCCVF